MDPVDYVESLDTPRRVRHGHQLLEIFGARPVMWGPSMIGYGKVHTGREGTGSEWGSVRARRRSPSTGSRARTPWSGWASMGCIYINKTEDIDLAVLEEMIADG